MMKPATDVFRSLNSMLTGHGVERRGIIHVGAHDGAEVPFYRECGFDLIRLVEPLPELAEVLPDDCDVIEAAVASSRGIAQLNVTPWGQQASLLQPMELRVVEQITVDTWPLRDLQDGCNVLVVDVQGSELDVLRSGDLGGFDMVIVEITSSVRYRGAGTRQDILEVLKEFRLVNEFPHQASSISDCVFVRCV